MSASPSSGRTRRVDRSGVPRLRTTPLVGEKVWFGPRGWGGWGWAPVSWEGWTVVLISGVAIATAIVRFGEERARLPAFGMVVLLVVVCWLKGTSPGSARAKAEFDRARRAQS